MAETPWGFDNSYARLPERFFARVAPTPVREPRWLALNEALAEELGLDLASLRSALRVFAGNALPPDAEPIALAYAGHQFGHFAGRLGDGRAILLGERMDRHGLRRDIQLKGSGRTPFSRGGDGRATIGPVLREYVVSEAMAALGVPTTRALAAVATGENVRRQTLLPGAVLTRVAKSHVRVGTFELFAGDPEALETLVGFCLQRHYPAAPRAALALLDEVVVAHASLVAQWLGVGFIHGVMNTDNTSISGETIDYGPCAFLDTYAPEKFFSSIDTQGRYAYGNQPAIAAWNMARFAETLLPLIAANPERAAELATEVLDTFPSRFESALTRVFRAKLGLIEADGDDMPLIAELLDAMAESQADFTVFFRTLAHEMSTPFPAWNARWKARLSPGSQALMLRSNPAHIPRNHRIEQMIEQAVSHDDLAMLHDLVSALREPFEDKAPWLAEPPAAAERVAATFCGT